MPEEERVSIEAIERCKRIKTPNVHGEPQSVFALLHPITGLKVPLNWYADGMSLEEPVLSPFDAEILERIKSEIKSLVKKLRYIDSVFFGSEHEDYPPKKADVIGALSMVYHALGAKTDFSKNYRRAIEIAFDTLELGPIPPLNFRDRLGRDDTKQGGPKL